MQTISNTNYSLEDVLWVNTFQSAESKKVGFYIGHNVDGAICVRIADLDLLLQYTCNGIRSEESQNFPLSQRTVVDHGQSKTRKSRIRRVLEKFLAGKAIPAPKPVETVTKQPVTGRRCVQLEGGCPLSFDPEVINAVLFQLKNEQRHFTSVGYAETEELTRDLPPGILPKFYKPVTENQASTS